MKGRFTILTLMMAMFIMLSCDNNDSFDDGRLSESQVPKAVLAEFDEKYPDATNVTWAKKYNSYAVASFTTNGQKAAAKDHTAWFEWGTGKWNMTEIEMPYAMIPDAVKTAFEASDYSKSPWVTDDEVDYLQRPGNAEALYVIQVEKKESGVETEMDLYYTADGQNIAVQMAELPLTKIYEQVGRTNVFQLEIEDENGVKTLHPVFVWDAQYSPVKNTFTHVDFFGVDLDKEIKVKVQVEYVGTPKGVKMGGTMETYRDEVVLSAKPADMPRKVSVDVSGLELNQTIRVSNMPLPEGVKAVYKSDFTMVSVFMEGAEEAPAE